MKKTQAYRVEYIQPIRIFQPYPAPAVLEQMKNLALPDGKGVKRVGRKDLEAGAVVAVQPVLGGYPDETVPALEDVENQSLREPVVDSEQGDVGRGLRGKAAGEKQQKKCDAGFFHQLCSSERDER
ncbi:MAG TPA: hypothetical protein PLW66_10840 [Saprospiraceae bacterium]|nr:hypothetical protein [Saprospiraceae bacterium]